MSGAAFPPPLTAVHPYPHPSRLTLLKQVESLEAEKLKLTNQLERRETRKSEAEIKLERVQKCEMSRDAKPSVLPA